MAGNLIFISRTHFLLRQVQHRKSFYNLRSEDKKCEIHSVYTQATYFFYMHTKLNNNNIHEFTCKTDIENTLYKNMIAKSLIII